MMERLVVRAEALARTRQRRQLRAVAEKLRSLLGEAAVDVEEARVLVRGSGIVKRWLAEPSLPFLAGVLE